MKGRRLGVGGCDNDYVFNRRGYWGDDELSMVDQQVDNEVHTVAIEVTKLLQCCSAL